MLLALLQLHLITLELSQRSAKIFYNSYTSNQRKYNFTEKYDLPMVKNKVIQQSLSLSSASPCKEA